MIEDRDGTVDAPSLLIVSIVLVENSVKRSENENVRTTRIRMVRFKLNLLRDSTIPLLDRYTHTHTPCNFVYTFHRRLEWLERVLSPSEKCPRRQEGGNSNRVENTANYRRPIETSSPSFPRATTAYFDNGTRGPISESLIRIHGNTQWWCSWEKGGKIWKNTRRIFYSRGGDGRNWKDVSRVDRPLELKALSRSRATLSSRFVFPLRGKWSFFSPGNF